jgi:hypothetical protein
MTKQAMEGMKKTDRLTRLDSGIRLNNKFNQNIKRLPLEMELLNHTDQSLSAAIADAGNSASGHKQPGGNNFDTKGIYNPTSTTQSGRSGNPEGIYNPTSTTQSGRPGNITGPYNNTGIGQRDRPNQPAVITNLICLLLRLQVLVLD